MNKTIQIFFYSLFCGLSLSAQNLNERMLDQFLTRWHQDAADCKLEAYFTSIAEDGVFIGTDSTEHWNKQEFYAFSKPYFDNGKSWKFKANSRHIFISDHADYAWFDELLYTGSTTWRGSGIIVQTPDGPKIKHYTLSVTVPNDKLKEFIELLRQ